MTPLSIVAGSNASLIVQLSPAEDPTGEKGIPLTGVAGVSAKARDVDSGVVVAFTAANVVDPLIGPDGKADPKSEGKVRLDYAADTFTPGTYVVQITFLDGAGTTHKYPSDGTSLKLRVVEGI